jgi:hypothetical protein
VAVEKASHMNYNEIVTKLPWLDLKINIPHEKMLEEARAVRQYFVPHRDEDAPGGYKHKGWESVCIHGLSAEKTNHFSQYGYTSNEEAPYKWTPIADLCPITVGWLLDEFPIDTFYRVRFMLLKPGGYIMPHKDSEKGRLGPINVALNQPKGCIFKMKDQGRVPMYPGCVMMLNVGNTHAYINTSNIERIHIIIHGIVTTDLKELVEYSYNE